MLSINEYLQIAVGIMTVFSPFAAVPIFVSLTAGHSVQEKNETAKTAAFAACIAGIISVFIGKYILSFFGISIASFQIAGGILLLLMAINMLNAKVPDAKNTKPELEEAKRKSSNIKEIAIVPLAIPLICGPGAISTIIIYSDKHTSLLHLLVVSLIVVLLSFFAFFSLKMSSYITKKLGITGINIISRIMGLLLAAISIEFIVSGLLSVFPILGLKGF